MQKLPALWTHNHQLARHTRCVKCNMDHPRNECPIIRNGVEDQSNESLFCVNCGSNKHPANYRGCPTYTAIIRRKPEKAEQERTRQAERQQSFNNFPMPNRSYANSVLNTTIQPTESTNVIHAPTATNQNVPIAPKNENCLEFLRRKCTNTFKHNLMEMFQLTTNFVPRYTQLCDNDKPMS